MHNHQTLYRLLLTLSGVGAVFALLAMFTSLLFPLCAVITILCYLVGAVLVLFVIPKRYRQEDKRKKLPLQVRALLDGHHPDRVHLALCGAGAGTDAVRGDPGGAELCVCLGVLGDAGAEGEREEGLTGYHLRHVASTNMLCSLSIGRTTA